MKFCCCGFGKKLSVFDISLEAAFEVFFEMQLSGIDALEAYGDLSTFMNDELPLALTFPDPRILENCGFVERFRLGIAAEFEICRLNSDRIRVRLLIRPKLSKVNLTSNAKLAHVLLDIFQCRFRHWCPPWD